MQRQKIIVGLFMIGSHFFIILMVMVAWLAGGFLFTEMVTAVGLIAPLFAGYTTVIIGFINDNREALPRSDTEVTESYKVVSFALPALFAFVTGASVVMWALRIGFSEFDQFKILVGMIQGIFGVYVGQLIYGMFKRPGEH